MTNLANNMDTVSGSSLCTWPANYEYYCLRDVFNNVGGSFVQTALLPVTDNCAAITDGGAGGALTVDPVRAMLGDASYPIPVYGSSGFSCVDTDQRSEVGTMRNLLHSFIICKVTSRKLMKVWKVLSFLYHLVFIRSLSYMFKCCSRT